MRLTGESVILAQIFFRAHFMLCRNDVVTDRKSIPLWVENLFNISYLGLFVNFYNIASQGHYYE